MKDIAPWLKSYRELGQVLLPYVVKISTPNFRSAVVNTDEYGFRLSHDLQGVLTCRSWMERKKRALLLGSSFAFGVGATQDKMTLASHLNFLTGGSFLNLAIRAANSTQELIASIPFLQSAESILIVSGLNNLIANIQSLGLNDLYGPLFGEEIFASVASYDFSLLPVLLKKRFAISFVDPRILIKGLWKFHRQRGNGKTSLPEQQSCEKGLQRALDLLKRDLKFIVDASPSQARLIYALQPIVSMSKTSLTLEEEKLIKMIYEGEGVQGEIWGDLKRKIFALWSEYARGVEGICRDLGLIFVDLNQVPLEGWSYVDPVHMTDAGYSQVAQYFSGVIVS